jgi:hypothetical protein
MKISVSCTLVAYLSMLFAVPAVLLFAPLFWFHEYLQSAAQAYNSAVSAGNKQFQTSRLF